ncbi:MAG: hypothetical protein BGO59_12530 [Spirosoma sp. 48-14]|nr:MAG: hypothetical protein BGO59_12530 [Spirosoma sp. 48-14]
MIYVKKLLLCLFCWLIGYVATAQRVDWAIGINKWYTKKEGIDWLLAHYRPIYDFRPNEKVASIGAGQGIREVAFSLMVDSLTVYLQDLDPYWFEPDRLTILIQAIYKSAARDACSATFVPVRGKEKETKLPKQYFDKIIVENSLHEFTYQAEMVQQIRENLKPNGQLFVWEAIATKPNRKHTDCRKPMFTDDTLIKLLTDNGFRFVSKTVVDPRRRKDAVFIFVLAY